MNIMTLGLESIISSPRYLRMDSGEWRGATAVAKRRLRYTIDVSTALIQGRSAVCVSQGLCGEAPAIAHSTAHYSEHRAELPRLQQKLRRMREFQTGWSYGEGEPVTQEAADAAEILLERILLMGLEADVFANLDGGCAAVAYRGDDTIELSVSSDGVLETATTERGTGPEFEVIDYALHPTEEHVAKILVKLLMRASREVECGSSESLTLSIMTADANDSEIWSTGTRPDHPDRPTHPTAEAASPLLASRVHVAEPPAFATTSSGTTRVTLAPHAAFGPSMKQQSLNRLHQVARHLS